MMMDSTSWLLEGARHPSLVEAAEYLGINVKPPWVGEPAEQGVYVARFAFAAPGWSGPRMILTKIGYSMKPETRLLSVQSSSSVAPRQRYCEGVADWFLIGCRSEAEAKAVESSLFLLLDRYRIRGEWFALAAERYRELRDQKLMAWEVIALAAGLSSDGWRE